jgi:cell division protein FtsB
VANVEVSRGRSHRLPAKPRRRPRFRLIYILVLAGMVLFAYQFLQKTREINRLRAQENALQYQNELIAQDNARLQRDIRWYRQPAYVEEAARNILGYTLPGEVVVESNPVHARPITRRIPPARPFTASPIWQQWWKAFFG